MCKRKDPVYVRPYSGEKLCAGCFCRSLENKLKATIAKYDMLHFDDRIAIGASGGKDSMALLHILAKLEKSFPKAELIAITVDEGIRSYRDEALKIAKTTCQKLNVEQVTVTFKKLFGIKLDELVNRLHGKETGSQGLTPCAYCGVLRRHALNSTARNMGATRLATAHNLDDETQTTLLNILHGDPLRISRGSPVLHSTHPQLVCRIKPFCEILEKEVTFYAYLKRIDFQTIPCPYSSEALRNDIRTMLNRMEEKHPGLKYTVFHSAKKLRASIRNVAEAEELGSCKECGEPTFNKKCQSCKLLQTLSI